MIRSFDSSEDAHKCNWPVCFARHVFCLTSHYVYLFSLTVQLSTMARTVKLRLKKGLAHTRIAIFVVRFLPFALECQFGHYNACRSLYFIIHLAHLFLFPIRRRLLLWLLPVSSHYPCSQHPAPCLLFPVSVVMAAGQPANVGNFCSSRCPFFMDFIFYQLCVSASCACVLVRSCRGGGVSLLSP